MYWAACVLVLVFAYTLTIVITSVGYHRGLTHGAVRLRPVVRRMVIAGGHWLTGIDPKAWVVMHRLHHAHSDRPEDPHSPVNVGLFGVPWQQIKSYARVIVGLRHNDPHYADVAPDVETSWPVASGLWFLPILTHAVISLAIGLAGGGWPLAPRLR